jgi:hypothetical protein
MRLVRDRALQALRRAQAFFGLVVLQSSTANPDRAPSISSGSGVPTANEPSGSVYLRDDGSGVNEAIYVRQGATWEPIEADSVDTIGGSTASAVTGVSVAVATELKREPFTDPAAAGTAIISQQNSDFDETSGIATPLYRNVQVVFSAGWDGGDIEVTGTDMTGVSATETITASAGSTVQGTKAYADITRIRNLGTHSTGTVDIEEGVHLGVPVGGKTPTAVSIVDLAAGNVAGATLSSVGLVDLNASPPNGTRDYLVSYTLAETPVVTDSGHAHAATGLTLS